MSDKKTRITRRDFLNGVSLSLVAAAAPSRALATGGSGAAVPQYYPPLYTFIASKPALTQES